MTDKLVSLETLVKERSSDSLLITKVERRLVILWYLGKNELFSKNRLPQLGHRYLLFLKTILVSREQMRNTPPNILITNYAMLEYLLLRPGDSIFFNSDNAPKWKSIVLDEAHTYGGAKGIEVGSIHITKI